MVDATDVSDVTEGCRMAIGSTATLSDTPTSGERHVQRLGAAIWSQFFVRIASSAGLLVIGSYFVDLQSRHVPITSLLVGIIAALVFLTELLFAPLALSAISMAASSSWWLAHSWALSP